MTDKYYIACDLGAESGRVILGSLVDGKLVLDEAHRFPSETLQVNGSCRWNLPKIFEELKEGLRKVAARGIPVFSLSVDSWGVDYAWFNELEPLLDLPFQYRDPRTAETYSSAIDQLGQARIFDETGIQFMSINTLYHLMADVKENNEVLQTADRFLTIADYLNYRFSGVAKVEVSNASTTQMYNPRERAWSKELIDAFNLPASLFPDIVASGTVLGPLTEDLSAETGLRNINVIATCSHDTGAAVAAIPALEGDDWAYLSSGTWSLIGVELPHPLINDEVRMSNFTNEAGYGGTTRFLKNIIGLWLLQESRRSWSSNGNKLEYDEINRLAESAEPFRSLIDPSDDRFLNPADMPATIAAFCRDTGQPEPETPGQFARCILESLALLYGDTLNTIEQLTNRSIKRLHIVGGGSQSRLLNQFSANATGRTVLAGPVEATAIGNVLIQAIANGDIASLAELRQIVRNSFTVESYQPEQSSAWQDARARLMNMKKRA